MKDEKWQKSCYNTSMIQRKKICPRCGRKYAERPALSRIDNKTKICPPCGTAEVLTDSLLSRVQPQN